MLKKTITYTDPFTDEQRTEDFYFNISKAEATEMAMVEGEGMEEHLKAIQATNDVGAILVEFKKIIAKAYGERTPDGRFIKSTDLSEKFLSSEAYSELFMEFIMDGSQAAGFLEGMMPKDLPAVVEQMKAQAEKNATPADPNDKRPAWIREDREPTAAEKKKMTKEQLIEVMERKNKKQ